MNPITPQHWLCWLEMMESVVQRCLEGYILLSPGLCFKNQTRDSQDFLRMVNSLSRTHSCPFPVNCREYATFCQLYSYSVHKPLIEEVRVKRWKSLLISLPATLCHYCWCVFSVESFIMWIGAHPIAPVTWMWVTLSDQMIAHAFVSRQPKKENKSYQRGISNRAEWMHSCLVCLSKTFGGGGFLVKTSTLESWL